MSGHGKGLVDAKSGFGVKTPLRLAIVTNDFFYNNSKDICDYLKLHCQADNRKYCHLETIERYENPTSLPLPRCLKVHVIAYHPDGSIQTKENICSCNNCLTGNLINCVVEKGASLYGCEDAEESDDENEEPEVGVDNYLSTELIFDVIKASCIIALNSPPDATEIFYLVKVIDICKAEADIVDSLNHPVLKGSKYFKCNYLEKINESKGFIQYKMISGDVFVLAQQVLCPFVDLSKDLKLPIEDYTFLCDMI